jgi:hypothetical protein
MEYEEVDPGVDSEIDDEEIWYADDPVADPKIDWFYKLRSFAPIAIVLLVTTIYLPSTVGGKITLNSNSAKIEFGQGVVNTQYCGLSASISVNLYSAFKNGSPGEHYLDRVKVSGIPAACANKEFKIQLFDDSSSSPLAFYGSRTDLTFSNTTAYKPCGDPDLTFDTKTVSSATEFNFNIANPTLLSGSIAKFVVMSGGLAASYTQFPAVGTVTPPLNTVGNTETFTSGSVTGKNGPTLAELKTAYAAKTWEQESAYLNVSTNGFQQFTICHAGTYEITAYGANGGSGSTAGGGGKGANAKGTFTLTNGQKLTIVVGQPGAWNGQSGGSYAGGGGGGSFVFSGTSISTNSVLVAAGGGAGKLGNYSGAFDATSTTLNASLTSDGNPAGGANCQAPYLAGLGLQPNLGGSNGGGGLATFGASGNDSWVYNGGAGGGISSSGTAGGNYGQSGTAISSTAVGGGSGYPPFGDGSFGGGGGAGASSSAGGGGGYSGGGGGRRFNGNSSLNVDCQIAGGGGSFVSPSATASSIVLGDNTSGSVVIKRIS